MNNLFKPMADLAAHIAACENSGHYAGTGFTQWLNAGGARFESFALGSVVKYASRYPNTHSAGDLLKACHYLLWVLATAAPSEERPAAAVSPDDPSAEPISTPSPERVAIGHQRNEWMPSPGHQWAGIPPEESAVGNLLYTVMRDSEVEARRAEREFWAWNNARLARMAAALEAAKNSNPSA